MARVLGAAALLFLLLATSSAFAADTVLRRKGSIVEEPEVNKYAVIFHAGSDKTRVYVFKFNKETMDLAKKPDEDATAGLSTATREEAEGYMERLFGLAEYVVNGKDTRSTTPLKLDVTPRLSESKVLICEAVREAACKIQWGVLCESTCQHDPKWTNVLERPQKGYYLWVGLNYLLGGLGGDYSQTVGVIDLGGDSVQMAYAVEKATANAPAVPDGKDRYITKYFERKDYNVYVHSYSHYGNLAARLEILKAKNGPFSRCMLRGSTGNYNYNGEDQDATASSKGAAYHECELEVDRTLEKCTFDGVWKGTLYVASSDFKATEVGLVDRATPAAFKDAAEKICQLSVEEASADYPKVRDPAYICMDLVYQYRLLVKVFRLERTRAITLVEKVKYDKNNIESVEIAAAWPLGEAIEAIQAGAPTKRLQDA